MGLNLLRLVGLLSHPLGGEPGPVRGKYPNERNATVGLRVFSKEAAKAELPGVHWHSLEDLYKI